MDGYGGAAGAAESEARYMRRKVKAIVQSNHENDEDHLEGMGAMKILRDRQSNTKVIHDCIHTRETDPDHNCASCFAGGARDIAHTRDKNRESDRK